MCHFGLKQRCIYNRSLKPAVKQCVGTKGDYSFGCLWDYSFGLWSRARWQQVVLLLQCCFTSTETAGAISYRRGAQDGHCFFLLHSSWTLRVEPVTMKTEPPVTRTTWWAEQAGSTHFVPKYVRPDIRTEIMPHILSRFNSILAFSVSLASVCLPF